MRERFFTVFEEIFPIEAEAGSSLGYRSYRDLHTEELEYSFVFNRAFPEKNILNVVIKMPDSVSAYDQMMTLHRRNPNENIESIKQKLKIKEWRLSETNCAAVKQQYDKFYRLSLVTYSAKDRAEAAKGEYTTTLHPRIHTFKANVSGGTMKLELTDSDHPFIQWAEKTQRAFEGCVTKLKKN